MSTQTQAPRLMARYAVTLVTAVLAVALATYAATGSVLYAITSVSVTGCLATLVTIVRGCLDLRRSCKS